MPGQVKDFKICNKLKLKFRRSYHSLHQLCIYNEKYKRPTNSYLHLTYELELITKFSNNPVGRKEVQLQELVYILRIFSSMNYRARHNEQACGYTRRSGRKNRKEHTS